MEPPPPEPVVLLVDDHRSEGRRAVVDSLRRRRLLGHVPVLVAGDSVTAVLPLSRGRLLVLADDEDGPAPGPTPEQVALQLASELGTSVGFADASGEPLGLVEVETAPEPRAEAEAETPDPPATATSTGGGSLLVVAGELPLHEGRDAELAMALGGLWLAPYERPLGDSGSGTLVIPDELDAVTVWSSAQRPVVLLSAVPGRVVVQAYLREDLRRARRRDRLAQRGLPGREWFVDLRPTELAGAARLDRLAGADRERVEHWQSPEFAPRADVDDLADELRLDRTRRSALAAALAAPLEPGTAHDLLVALGVPEHLAPDAAAVLEGADPARVPDAVRVERQGLGGMLWRGITAEPVGTSWTSAWRRLPHRHPWAAAVLAAVNLTIGAGLLWWSATDRTLLAGGAWTALLVVLGLVWVTEGVLETALLRHARRHRDRPQDGAEPSPGWG